MNNSKQALLRLQICYSDTFQGVKIFIIIELDVFDNQFVGILFAANAPKGTVSYEWLNAVCC